MAECKGQGGGICKGQGGGICAGHGERCRVKDLASAYVLRLCLRNEVSFNFKGSQKTSMN